jgi:kumamolisin
MSKNHEYWAVEGSERTVLPGAKAIGRANSNATIEVTLKLRRMKALPPLTGRPDRTITRADLSNEYGASQADIDKVIETFRKYDLEIVESDPGTRTVRLRGSISAMENAFQVKLFNYSHDTHSYRGRVGPVHVPVACKDIVEGVFGLDNRQVAHRKQVGSHRNPQFSSVQSSWYLPNELAKHYNFPDGDGAGQAVALLEFGGGYFEDDLKQFCDLANI